MIIIKISGGLGNQLYQYTLYRLLSKRYPNVKIKADISNYKLYNVHNGYELDRIFGKEKKQIIPLTNSLEQFFHCGEIPIFCGGRFGKKLETVIAWINARSRNLFAKRGWVQYLDEEEINDKYVGEEKAIYIKDKLEKLDIAKNWYIAGYWQDEWVYEKDIPALCTQLEFPPFTDKINLEWKEKIEECNSVSVHVRRGDYVGSKYDVLTMEYYKNAVCYIKTCVKNPVFFVFSEDEDYVKKAFQWLDDKYVISNNRGSDSYKDMQLMSLCSHNIVANSTFSEWAAYMNRNVDKIVIYPESVILSECKPKKYGRNWKCMNGK